MFLLLQGETDSGKFEPSKIQYLFRNASPQTREPTRNGIVVLLWKAEQLQFENALFVPRESKQGGALFAPIIRMSKTACMRKKEIRITHPMNFSSVAMNRFPTFWKTLSFFVRKKRFSLEIETYYTPDGGHQENVFNLSDSEQRGRVVDLIDVVKDQVRERGKKQKFRHT